MSLNSNDRTFSKVRAFVRSPFTSSSSSGTLLGGENERGGGEGPSLYTITTRGNVRHQQTGPGAELFTEKNKLWKNYFKSMGSLEDSITEMPGNLRDVLAGAGVVSATSSLMERDDAFLESLKTVATKFGITTVHERAELAKEISAAVREVGDKLSWSLNKSEVSKGIEDAISLGFADKEQAIEAGIVLAKVREGLGAQEATSESLLWAARTAIDESLGKDVVDRIGGMIKFAVAESGIESTEFLEATNQVYNQFLQIATDERGVVDVQRLERMYGDVYSVMGAMNTAFLERENFMQDFLGLMTGAKSIDESESMASILAVGGAGISIFDLQEMMRQGQFKEAADIYFEAVKDIADSIKDNPLMISTYSENLGIEAKDWAAVSEGLSRYDETSNILKRDIVGNTDMMVKFLEEGANQASLEHLLNKTSWSSLMDQLTGLRMTIHDIKGGAGEEGGIASAGDGLMDNFFQGFFAAQGFKIFGRIFGKLKSIPRGIFEVFKNIFRRGGGAGTVAAAETAAAGTAAAGTAAAETVTKAARTISTTPAGTAAAETVTKAARTISTTPAGKALYGPHGEVLRVVSSGPTVPLGTVTGGGVAAETVGTAGRAGIASWGSKAFGALSKGAETASGWGRKALGFLGKGAETASGLGGKALGALGKGAGVLGRIAPWLLVGSELVGVAKADDKKKAALEGAGGIAGGLVGLKAGSLVGAKVGASAGTLVGGPLGTVVGGILGTVAGGVVGLGGYYLGKGFGNLINKWTGSSKKVEDSIDTASQEINKNAAFASENINNLSEGLQDRSDKVVKFMSDSAEEFKNISAISASFAVNLQKMANNIILYGENFADALNDAHSILTYGKTSSRSGIYWWRGSGATIGSGIGDAFADASSTKKVEGLDKEFIARLEAMSSYFGKPITVTSGYRARSEQLRIWNDAVAKYGPAEARNWAAPPGRSNHERGIAVDVGGWAKDLSNDQLAMFGLTKPLSWEPWHIEPVEARGGTFAGSFPSRGTTSKISGLDIANKLTSYGISAEDARILAAVAYAESSYRPGAVGDNGESFGLFQIHIPAHWDKLQKHTGSSDRSVWEDWLKDVNNNIFMASEVYKSQGLGAWTMYRNQMYRQYLDNLDELYISGSGVEFLSGTGGLASRGSADTWKEIPAGLSEQAEQIYSDLINEGLLTITFPNMGYSPSEIQASMFASYVNHEGVPDYSEDLAAKYIRDIGPYGDVEAGVFELKARKQEDTVSASITSGKEDYDKDVVSTLRWMTAELSKKLDGLKEDYDAQQALIDKYRTGGGRPVPFIDYE
jgi:hypothetical protein